MNVEDIKRAMEWRKEHGAHVAKLVSMATRAYPPSGSDEIRPELWKAEHWAWFSGKDE